LIKPNQAELAELTGQVVKSLEDTYRAASVLQRTFGVDLIATMGEQGALALIGQKHYYIPPLRVEVVSTAGAGDAILAGMAVALSRREPPEAGLRLGLRLGPALCCARWPLRTTNLRTRADSSNRSQLLPWPS
jgi:fructose-1-phosphate kinase PfkB-like protein